MRFLREISIFILYLHTLYLFNLCYAKTKKSKKSQSTHVNNYDKQKFVPSSQPTSSVSYVSGLEKNVINQNPSVITLKTAVGIPIMHNVEFRNTEISSMKIESIHISSVNFYVANFESITLSSNTVSNFQLYFVPFTDIIYEGMMSISTSFGLYQFKLIGVCSSNPYQISLQNVYYLSATDDQDVKLPIHLYNPFSKPLEILDVSSSRKYLKLQNLPLDTGNVMFGKAISSWHIPPYSSKEVFTVLISRALITKGLYVDCIEVKTNYDSLVIPIQIHVMADGIERKKGQELDFGVITKRDDTREINLEIYSTYKVPVQILSAQPSFGDSSIHLNITNSVIPAGSDPNDAFVIGTVTFTSKNEGRFFGSVIVTLNDSMGIYELEVFYKATVKFGGIGFDESLSRFFLPINNHSLSYPQELSHYENRSITIKNYFSFPVKIETVEMLQCKDIFSISSVESEASSFGDFSPIYVVLDSLKAFNMNMRWVDVDCPLLITTNVSNINFSFHVYDLALYLMYTNMDILDKENQYNKTISNTDNTQWNLGLVSLFNSPPQFVYFNPNPISIPVKFSNCSDIEVCCFCKESSWHHHHKKTNTLVFEEMMNAKFRSFNEILIDYNNCICQFQSTSNDSRNTTANTILLQAERLTHLSMHVFNLNETKFQSELNVANDNTKKYINLSSTPMNFSVSSLFQTINQSLHFETTKRQVCFINMTRTIPPLWISSSEFIATLKDIDLNSLMSVNSTNPIIGNNFMMFFRLFFHNTSSCREAIDDIKIFASNHFLFKFKVSSIPLGFPEDNPDGSFSVLFGVRAFWRHSVSISYPAFGNIWQYITKLLHIRMKYIGYQPQEVENFHNRIFDVMNFLIDSRFLLRYRTISEQEQYNLRLQSFRSFHKELAEMWRLIFPDGIIFKPMYFSFITSKDIVKESLPLFLDAPIVHKPELTEYEMPLATSDEVSWFYIKICNPYDTLVNFDVSSSNEFHHVIMKHPTNGEKDPSPWFQFLGCIENDDSVDDELLYDDVDALEYAHMSSFTNAIPFDWINNDDCIYDSGYDGEFQISFHSSNFGKIYSVPNSIASNLFEFEGNPRIYHEAALDLQVVQSIRQYRRKDPHLVAILKNELLQLNKKLNRNYSLPFVSIEMMSLQPNTSDMSLLEISSGSLLLHARQCGFLGPFVLIGDLAKPNPNELANLKSIEAHVDILIINNFSSPDVMKVSARMMNPILEYSQFIVTSSHASSGLKSETFTIESKSNNSEVLVFVKNLLRDDDVSLELKNSGLANLTILDFLYKGKTCSKSQQRFTNFPWLFRIYPSLYDQFLHSVSCSYLPLDIAVDETLTLEIRSMTSFAKRFYELSIETVYTSDAATVRRYHFDDVNVTSSSGHLQSIRGKFVFMFSNDTIKFAVQNSDSSIQNEVIKLLFWISLYIVATLALLRCLLDVDECYFHHHYRTTAISNLMKKCAKLLSQHSSVDNFIPISKEALNQVEVNCSSSRYLLSDIFLNDVSILDVDAFENVMYLQAQRAMTLNSIDKSSDTNVSIQSIDISNNESTGLKYKKPSPSRSSGRLHPIVEVESSKDDDLQENSFSLFCENYDDFVTPEMLRNIFPESLSLDSKVSSPPGFDINASMTNDTSISLSKNEWLTKSSSDDMDDILQMRQSSESDSTWIGLLNRDNELREDFDNSSSSMFSSSFHNTFSVDNDAINLDSAPMLHELPDMFGQPYSMRRSLFGSSLFSSNHNFRGLLGKSITPIVNFSETEDTRTSNDDTIAEDDDLSEWLSNIVSRTHEK